jgi:hypothetical protein
MTAGLVPAIHAFNGTSTKKGVDARHKAGHGGDLQLQAYEYLPILPIDFHSHVAYIPIIPAREGRFLEAS